MIEEKKLISPEEQKKMLLDMLKYVDAICRKNDIQYSLIGGSLIGAIRHKGFIPWDDDVDIILDYKNYVKLMRILKEQKNDNYDILIPGSKGYPLHILKLVNKHTSLEEAGLANKIENYGLFLDIFCYHHVPNDEVKRKKFFKRLNFLRKSLVRVKLNHRNPSFAKKIVRLFKNMIVFVFGNRIFLNRYLNLLNKYECIDAKYVVSDNPVYSYEKEIQEFENIKEYIDVYFEGIKVMIFKNYDKILHTTFGNYMQLPPVEKRVTHELTVYYK